MVGAVAFERLLGLQYREKKNHRALKERCREKAPIVLQLKKVLVVARSVKIENKCPTSFLSYCKVIVGLRKRLYIRISVKSNQKFGENYRLRSIRNVGTVSADG